MPRNQGRTRGTNRDRSRTQAREQSQRMRQELEALADPETFDSVPAAGTPLPNLDLDDFDDRDSDDLLDPEDESAEEDQFAGPTTFRRLLGTQPPLALLALTEAPDGALRARPLVAPRTTIHEALTELVALVEEIFRRGRAELAEAEWAALLGHTAAPLVHRLLALAKISLTGADRIPLAEGASFQPNNRGLERYVGKLALLPDGLCFSLRLLLKGTLPPRSKDPDMANHPFSALPEVVKLLALKRALALEAAEGVARTDEDFRALLGQALTDLGLAMPRPYWKHVEMLRSGLTRRGLPDAFPNSRRRQQAYDEAKTASKPPAK